MAADEGRAERIRHLKLAHPEFTWQAIADYVGVSLRAAQAWQETGGISYPNAKKLAELWREDVLYVMQGERPETPDLFAVEGNGDQLERIERKLDVLIRYLNVPAEIVGQLLQGAAGEEAIREGHPGPVRDGVEQGSPVEESG